MGDVIRLPALYAKQRAAFFHDARIGVCEASTKAGKSVGALTWLLYQAIEKRPGAAQLWVAPVYAQAKVMHARLTRWMTRADPTHHSAWDKNDSDLTVRVPGGSVLWFKGGDNPDSIYGSDYAGCVIDEASRCKEEVWYAVRSTLTATGGPVRLIGNVKGRKNWAYQLARRAQSGEPNMAYHKLTAWDAVEAGVITADEVEQARRTLPENVYRELYLAEPSDDGGNPFGLAAIRKCVIPTLSTAEPRCFGVDLAKSQDWTVVIGMDAAGRVCRYDRWQSDWGQTIRRVRDMVGTIPSLIDSTGVGDPIVEELQRTMPPGPFDPSTPGCWGSVSGFKFSAPSKQRLMEGLASSIQQQAIGYPEGQITMELDTFEFEYTRTGVRYTAPEGLTDDCVCALALCDQKRRDLGTHVSIVGGGRPIIVSGN